jgi:hypothetical protein
MRSSNETIGNRSRDLPVCSTVPQLLRQSVAPPPYFKSTLVNLILNTFKFSTWNVSVSYGFYIRTCH